MNSDNGESQHTSDNEVDQSKATTSRRLSDVMELQLSEITASSGSYVWNHFTKDPDYKNNKKANCNYCHKTYICSAGTTSGISKHLKKFHVTKLLTEGNQKVNKSILDMFNESKWSYDKDIMMKILIRWIVIHQHSFTIVEENYFINFVHSLHPSAKIPSTDTIKNKIMTYYEEDKVKMKALLKDLPGKVSFTMDCWTSPSTKSFLSITAHFINKEWNLQNIIIDFIQTQDSHTGSNIKDAFLLGISNMSLESKIMGITTDNASNNSTFMTSLSIWAAENLRELIVKIRASFLRREKLSNACKNNDINDLKPILDVPTRWNSTFDMIKRALQLKVALEYIVFHDKDLKKYTFSEEKWAIFEQIKNFLEIFKEVTVIMLGSHYPTLSLTVPLYNILIDHVEDVISNDKEDDDDEDDEEENEENNEENDGENDDDEKWNQIVKKAAKKCKVKLLEYYNKTNDTYLISIILDPRLKLKYYKDHNWEETLVNTIYQKFVNIYNKFYASTKPEVLNNTSEIKEKSVMSRVFKRRNIEYINEIQTYLSLSLMNEETDPLEWWKVNESQFPHLSQMA
ncbi:unnamed protein product [Rhizophagus irregularis]|uniref:BED-type domain-containing protein n=1 Tax=Rhizophagus irregularis TaxID=588596 RepID=A0A915YXW4_9GLOM|nr:unnamed protein product [Rhizophagus irregularis]